MKLSQEQIDYCMECGVCTGSCPISRVLPGYSPRQMIKRALMDRDETLLSGPEIWACLTCSRCSARCPVGIDFPEFIRAHRKLAAEAGNTPRQSHHGTLQVLSELQTRTTRQQRTGWAKETGSIRETGDVFFFVGCAPYFDAALQFGNGSLAMAKSLLQLMNRLGIEPVVSDRECCCGHDALWRGEEETFRKLAAKNLEAIKDSGAKTVVFGCPEGYVTFKEHVPAHFGDLPFEVLHATEFLARELPSSKVAFKAGNESATFHDPCRLGRRAGIYDPPRDLLKLVPGVRFKEMERSRENSMCCGTSGWIECSGCSKAMQVERLREALDTGADTFVTACPKCGIHFNCALSNSGLEIDVVDLYSFLLNHIE